MGRMKDSLVDRPPTLGDLRRQGVVALTVRCRRPCKRIGRVTFDTLRVPDDTALAQIPKLRRLRCEACDRCVPDLEPIWPVQPAEPVGAADALSARWALTIEDAGGQTGISSPFWSRQDTARFARQQIADGATVLRIETPTGIIEADEVAVWLALSDRS